MQQPGMPAGPRTLSVMGVVGFILFFVGIPMFFVLFIGMALWLTGLVLGILGMRESGKRGRKSGWGLALAAVILNALSLLGGGGILIVGLLFMSKVNEMEQQANQDIEADFNLIKQRLQAYYRANNSSLQAGGPAQAPSMRGQTMDFVSAEYLVDLRELKYSEGMTIIPYSIEVTGPNSARVSCNIIGIEVGYMIVTDVGGGKATIELEPGS